MGDRQTLSVQTLQELSELSGVNLKPERLERIVAHMVPFFQYAKELEKEETGELEPDFIQPLAGVGS